MRTFLLALALAAGCSAQDAKIMIVERSDSAKLSKAYKEYKDAQKRWEDLKAQVAKNYTEESGKIIPGWEKIQFSADFRALVPETSQFVAGHGLSFCNGYLTTNTSNISGEGISSVTVPSVNASVNPDLTVKEPK